MASQITGVSLTKGPVTRKMFPFDDVIMDHYNDVIMSALASRITSLAIVYSTVYSDQGKHQTFASLAFVRGIQRSPYKGPVPRKMFPFDDVIIQ